MTQECLFVAEVDSLAPTEWAVGPWSTDTLQGSACCGLLVRTLERSDTPPGMQISRLSFDLWRPVTREHLIPGVSTLRDGRKARTVEASLTQAGRPVARCTALYLAANAQAVPVPSVMAPPPLGPEDGRPVPPQVRAWSPFFTGVDTRVVEGDLLKPGPAAAWFNLGRSLVRGEATSPLVHAVSAADLASGISAVVDLRAWTFINADLTVLFWRMPRAPWILLHAETAVGDRGTGLARGTLSDVDGPFGACEQTLLFERRQPPSRGD